MLFDDFAFPSIRKRVREDERKQRKVSERREGNSIASAKLRNRRLEYGFMLHTASSRKDWGNFFHHFAAQVGIRNAHNMPMVFCDGLFSLGPR
jgi:hypothetical protein